MHLFNIFYWALTLLNLNLSFQCSYVVSYVVDLHKQFLVNDAYPKRSHMAELGMGHGL